MFDALRMPAACNEIGGEQPSDDENPFFCLLEDDKFITSVNVTTDRLLLPMEDNDRLHDVHLVIHVRINDPDAIFTDNRLV